MSEIGLLTNSRGLVSRSERQKKQYPMLKNIHIILEPII